MGGVAYSSHSWRDIVYLLTFVVTFGSVIPACFIFAKKVGQNRRLLEIYSIYSLLTGVSATFFLFVLSAVRIDGPSQAHLVSLWQALLIVASRWQTLLIVTVCLWIGITAVTLFFSSHESNAK
jgi:hypothetical protein